MLNLWASIFSMISGMIWKDDPRVYRPGAQPHQVPLQALRYRRIVFRSLFSAAAPRTDGIGVLLFRGQRFIANHAPNVCQNTRDHFF